jgi:RNA polymerase sigma-70 factor (ECF subfamily)
MSRLARRRGHEDSPEKFFERIYRDTYRNTLAYALRRTPTSSDAHDVVSDTYLVAWRRVNDLRKVAEPQAWLYGIAYRSIGNQRRGAQRRTALAAKAQTIGEAESEHIDPACHAESSEELRMVGDAMARLTPRDQEILRLAAFEEMTYKEIASVLNLQPAIVRTILYRARQRLTRELEAPGARHRDETGHSAPGSELIERDGDPYHDE